jgi:hypothetical protein
MVIMNTDNYKSKLKDLSLSNENWKSRCNLITHITKIVTKANNNFSIDEITKKGLIL